MPVFRNGARLAGQVSDLTGRLIAELSSDRTEGQPIVYEDRIGQSHQYSVTVIWDEWADLDRIARSRVILDAYESADPSKTGRISIAMGLTTAEASSIGILPFAVLPYVGGSDLQKRQRVLEKFRKESGATASAGGGFELRFRTFAEAAVIAARLRSEMPEAEWVIVKSVRANSDRDED